MATRNPPFEHRPAARQGSHSHVGATLRAIAAQLVILTLGGLRFDIPS
ncbi:MAG: hypothetical protein ACFB6S_05370 [Geminicoccaceae bacterium]